MLLIVPACGREAYEHFKRTIERAWTVEDLLGLGVSLPEDLLERLRGVGEFRVWGCVPGVRGWDRVWGRLEGFVVAFYRDGAIVCWGRVFARIRDPVLAEKLWGRDVRGRTWEYVYFIRDLRWARIPWGKVRAELGYRDSFIPQGHTVVSEDRVKMIIEKYGSVEGFFEALGGVDALRRSREFRHDRLQLHSVGVKGLREATGIEDPYEAVLYLYGRVLVELASSPESRVSKDRVDGLAGEVLGAVVDGYSAAKAMLYNDLRRLCVLSIGGGGDWRKDSSARFTRIGRWVRRCVEVLRSLGVEESREFYVFIGALPVALCAMGLGCDCINGEAGFCLSLARGDLSGLDSGNKSLIRRALEVVEERVDWLHLCGVYGVDVSRIARLSGSE